jgi:hypothetical protein
VLLRRTDEDQTEQFEPKERDEGLSSMVKKPFRCLIGIKAEEAGMDTLTPRIYQYIPPGSFADAVGIETIHKDKSEKKKSRKKEKRPAELKEVSPTSVATHVSKHRLETKAAGEESSSLSRSIFKTNPFVRNRSVEEPKESPAVSVLARNRSFEEPPRDLDSLPQLNKMLTLSILTRNRSQSFENASPPNWDEFPQIEKKLSFVDAIPTATRNDPLDSHSIRDVSKALREMERKLNAADTEGKRVSRSKVMKALLTVVDQLDEDYDYSPEVKVITDRPSNDLSRDRPLSPPVIARNDRLLPPPVVTRSNVVSRLTSPAANVISSHQSPETTVVSSHKSPGTTVVSSSKSPATTVVSSHKSPATTAFSSHKSPATTAVSSHQSPATTVVSSHKSPATNMLDALATEKSKGVITPTEELCRNWAGPSFDANTKQRVEPAPVLENRAKSLRVQPSAFASDDVPWKGRPSPFTKTDVVKAVPTAETEEVDYISSDEASQSSSNGASSSSSAASNEKETVFSGESTHFSDKTKTKKGAFAHAGAPRRRKLDDFFPLDMSDPVVNAGVKDALCDLMWIPSFPNAPKIEESKKNIPKSSVAASRKKTMLDKLRAESVDWYKEEEGDESELSYENEYEESTANRTRSSQRREETRDRSWWRRSRSIKPPSNDTPNVFKTNDTPNVVKPIEYQTKVTVTSDRWKEILY